MNLCFVIFKYGVKLDDPCCYPLGAAYIIAQLKRMGHDVRVLNFNLWDYDLRDEFAGRDAVLFTGGEEFLERIKAAAEIAKEAGAMTVLGGSLATHRPFEMRDWVDSVVVREGEGALLDALAAPGIYQAHPVPMSIIPWPAYEEIGIEEYHFRHGTRYMGVLASRGCMGQCSFCAHTSDYRVRPLDDVFAEIEHYQATYSVSDIVFNDNTLNASRTRWMDICDGMQGRGLRWSAAIRTDRLDEEMVTRAKKSGLHYCVVGVESWLQDRLDRMGKRTTVSQNKTTLDLLEKHGVGYHGNILLGFDWDTEADISRELAAVPKRYRLFPMLFQPFCGVPAKPGTAGDQRRVLSDKFRRFAEAQGMSVYPEVAVC